MKKIFMPLFLVTILPLGLLAQETKDSIPSDWEKEFELNEVVVVGSRPVIKQEPDRIVYLTKNDPYALGLNGVQVLDRIPRVSVTNDQVRLSIRTMWLIPGMTFIPMQFHSGYHGLLVEIR